MILCLLVVIVQKELDVAVLIKKVNKFELPL